jgi:O-antigen ligase
MDWYYAYNNIFNVIELGVERINDEKLNSNTLAYHTFYATFAIYMLGEICFNRKTIYDILFILMLPLSFFTAIYTASRQVLIIQLPLISILLYIRYLKNNAIEKKFQFGFIAILIGLTVLPFVIEKYDNSYLKERNEINIEDDSRTKLAKDALKVGFEYFPLGVGPGNYVVHSYNKHFSHNTYTELFANEGIVGLIIYLVIVIGFVIEQWKIYRMYDDDIPLAFFWVGVFFIIDGFFYSFYQHLWLISFLILITTHSRTYYETYLIDDYMNE